MIDNIKIYIPLSDGKNWLNHIAYDTRTGADHYTGHIKNIKIMQNLDGVLLQGSIAKYLNNENIAPLNREQIKTSLEHLQNDTRISFDNAIIKGLEIGTSIIMNNPVCNYLQLFNYMPIYTRHEYGLNGLETVGYFTKTGSFGFYAYDKTKEMQSKKKDIPELYKECYVLRLEYRIKSRQGIKERFKKDLKPFDLCAYEVYSKLQALFYDFYCKIPKAGEDVFINTKQNLTPSELESLIYESFRQIHPKEYALILQNGKDKGFINEKSLERIKANNRKNEQNYTFSDKNNLIIELDEKMRLGACYGA